MSKQASGRGRRAGWTFRKGYQGEDPPPGVTLSPPKGPAAWVPVKPNEDQGRGKSERR